MPTPWLLSRTLLKRFCLFLNCKERSKALCLVETGGRGGDSGIYYIKVTLPIVLKGTLKRYRASKVIHQLARFKGYTPRENLRNKTMISRLDHPCLTDCNTGRGQTRASLTWSNCTQTTYCPLYPSYLPYHELPASVWPHITVCRVMMI